jgi:hypothetical protein
VLWQSSDSRQGNVDVGFGLILLRQAQVLHLWYAHLQDCIMPSVGRWLMTLPVSLGLDRLVWSCGMWFFDFLALGSTCRNSNNVCPFPGEANRRGIGTRQHLEPCAMPTPLDPTV